MKRSLIPVLMTIVLVVPAGPYCQDPAADAGPATVGEFAVRVVQGLGIDPTSGHLAPEGAAWVLLRKGITVRPELSSPLTEADAVSVLQALGLNVRTSTPSRVLTRDRLAILAEALIRPAE